MSGIGTGFAALSTLKKVGIGLLVVFALVGMVLLYGRSQYNSGYDKGELDTDAKWELASQKLKEEAAKSATRADDKAAQRLDEFVTQAEDDRKAVEDAQANGTSPLDALFGD